MIFYPAKTVKIILMVILQTKQELEKRLELLRAKYRQAVSDHDGFSIKRFEWEGKYMKKMLLELVSGTNDPDAPLSDMNRQEEIARMIFG
jgi:hypothetical protein